MRVPVQWELTHPGAVSENGVVFFRKQANLTNDLQKKLVLLLGKLTCRPDVSLLPPSTLL